MRLAVALAVTVVAGGCQPSVHDVIASGGEADRLVIDTERVCARREAAGYSQIPLSTARWHDLALRADESPKDPETLRTIARLMRANRDRFRDSVCTEESIAILEAAARSATKD